MNKLVHTLIVSILLSLGLASTARAADEQATVGLQVEPVGTLYQEAFRPARWELSTLISTSTPTIYPLRVADIGMGPNVRFNPDPDMPVCPDSEVGPDVNLSAPVATIVARCPQSVLGNGTALFQLAGVNAPNYQLPGYMVIFNGGRDAQGHPQIKIYAYSYATGVAIYTTSALIDGQLSFAVPRLSYDSAVTSMNLSIPGEEIPITDPAAPPGLTVPAGQDPNYAQARCPGDSWALSGQFLLGNRDSAGQPVPPETTISAEDSLACQGQAGQGKISKPQASGPGKMKVGASGKFQIKISNKGTATAKSLRIKVSGPKVAISKSVGSLGLNQSKTVTIKVKARMAGKQSWKFQVLSSNSAKVATSKKMVVNKR
jgi:hypothetical protein